MALLGSNKVAVEPWLHNTTTPSSPDYFGRWRKPRAPLVLFDPRIGVFAALRQSDKGSGWMTEWLASDLELLYALRNSIVHTGHGIFSPRMAGYLATLGAELLLKAMGARAQNA